jgi:hypothetical protein
MVITIRDSCIFVIIAEFQFPLEFKVLPGRHHFRISTLARLLNAGVNASVRALGNDCSCQEFTHFPKINDEP